MGLFFLYFFVELCYNKNNYLLWNLKREGDANMKPHCFKIAIVKNELLRNKRAGHSYHDMFLTREQEAYAQKLCETYGWRKEEILHRVQTKCFKDIRQKSELLKKIHSAKRENKETIALRLSETDKKVLMENGVKYWPIKFRIYFKSKSKLPKNA